MREAFALSSINRGVVAPLARNGTVMHSAIVKRPVAGPVEILETGLAGDEVGDPEHHGGPDQAIYAYSCEDYEWWSDTLGRPLPPGTFGENLTIAGLPTNPNIGDRLLIGEVVLEITAPRIPCNTLAAHMNDSGFGLAFRRAERPGVYCRVLNAGQVAQGDSVTLVPHESSGVSVLELFRFKYALRHEAPALHRLLEAPLATRFRAIVESKLLALESVSG